MEYSWKFFIFNCFTGFVFSTLWLSFLALLTSSNSSPQRYPRKTLKTAKFGLGFNKSLSPKYIHFFPLGGAQKVLQCLAFVKAYQQSFLPQIREQKSDWTLLRGSFWRSQLHGADCKGLGRFRTSSCIRLLATAGLVQRWSVGQDEHEDMWTYGDFWIHMDHVGFDVWNPLPGKTWATWDWDKSCYTHVADHLPASWKLTFSYHMLSLDTWSRPSKKLWFVGTHCHKSPWILPFDLKRACLFLRWGWMSLLHQRFWKGFWVIDLLLI